MQLLGGLTPAKFLANHWQKKPLLVRQAVPGFAGIMDRDEMQSLAGRTDATARLVIGAGKKWERHDGPFDTFAGLPKKKWTMLLYGVEGLVPGGWELLSQFDFIPRARIDDLMVSFAVDGGSVGPHEDDYDVFLLQGPGRRRWQIAKKYDATPIAGAAIKVLPPFEPDEEWVLEPGDMLYLPPHVAHHGVALGECFTYSIGFLAPTRAELAESFMGWLPTRVRGSDQRFADRGRTVAERIVGIDDDMFEFTRETLASIRWNVRDEMEFLGCFLTRPKASAQFVAGKKLGKEARLALPTRMLVDAHMLFINGIAYRLPNPLVAPLAELARTRSCLVTPMLKPLLAELHERGWVV